ncbi:MAG TPA: site-2 protease family protein [Candidatus Binatia bacterium]|nr:site-2 protease family protein [Candidatus Binatia bacterium]
MQLFLFIVALALFTGLVLVHEWGHFIVARRNGVDVEEFGLGFPPRAWSRKLKSGMHLSLNWLPIGGFVKLKGEHDGDKTKGSFGAATLGVKTKILLAGVTMNLIVAFLMLTALAVIGLPKLITTDQFGVDQFSVKSDTKISKQEVLVIYIEPNSPAKKIGLSGLDQIISISNGQKTIKIAQPEDLKNATTGFAGQKVTVTFAHDGNQVTKTVQLRSKAEVAPSLNTDNPKGYLGVEPYGLEFVRSTWSAPIVAAGFTWQLTKLTFVGLGHALAGLGSLIAGFASHNTVARQAGQTEATSQVGGPVAIFKILWGTGSIGYQYMLAIIALISLTLAIFNVLPIPALDGGRLFMILFSRLVLKRPLSRSAEEKAVATGMAVLLSLMVVITVVDVRRFL